MAESCANCGRADLLQPDLANYQCLACGALTDMATDKVVVAQEPGPNLSPLGYPVVELSHGVVESTDPGEDRRIRPIGETPVVPDAPVVTAPEIVTPAPIDLTGLTLEQVAAIEAIAHPGV